MLEKDENFSTKENEIAYVAGFPLAWKILSNGVKKTKIATIGLLKITLII